MNSERATDVSRCDWSEILDRGADAVKLCALVYTNGKNRDRIAMTVDDAVKQTGFVSHRLKEALVWAIVCGWMRLRAGHINLTAAGIYRAKIYLNLPH